MRIVATTMIAKKYHENPLFPIDLLHHGVMYTWKKKSYLQQ